MIDPKKLKTLLSTKGLNNLEAEVQKTLAENHEDKDMEQFFKSDGLEWGGYTPPHTLDGSPDGITYEEYIKKNVQENPYEDPK